MYFCYYAIKKKIKKILYFLYIYTIFASSAWVSRALLGRGKAICHCKYCKAASRHERRLRKHFPFNKYWRRANSGESQGDFIYISKTALSTKNCFLIFNLHMIPPLPHPHLISIVHSLLFLLNYLLAS